VVYPEGRPPVRAHTLIASGLISTPNSNSPCEPWGWGVALLGLLRLYSLSWNRPRVITSFLFDLLSGWTFFERLLSSCLRCPGSSQGIGLVWVHSSPASAAAEIRQGCDAAAGPRKEPFRTVQHPDPRRAPFDLPANAAAPVALDFSPNAHGFPSLSGQ